ncbi:acetoacetyl-CoA synthetase [Emericellopsis cladophorae]|uniref:Acetoacetyl-CoA synthetase n=1 Tax=Emericellopsis cladophorae TaxID=2686198 RepID=A0A9P9Y2J7_9HYPO|nr:acetoacetyl-CoA synthetase [Emericellopsis cladophorae]KAI6782428.1 acetoacetyl-CoA synthetase [Emericellopsis cladophorae]
MDVQTVPRKLWEHPNPESTTMYQFMQDVNRMHDVKLKKYDDLYQWSVNNRGAFYDGVWKLGNWIHEGTYSRVVDETAPITDLPKWFEGVKVNFAETFLWTTGASPGERTTTNKEDDRVAVTEIREGNTEVRNHTWADLRRRAGELAGSLKARGVVEGDRVVVVGAHSVSTFTVMLATLWLGGIFSSSSTDMGVGGLLQRTTQIDPKFVFFDDGAIYNGKKIDLQDKIQGVTEGMRKCSSFKATVIIPRFEASRRAPKAGIDNTETLEAFLRGSPAPPPELARVAFQAPSIIYYSSGTTGTPKAIVHSTGPLLLNLSKESTLHHDLDRTDVAMQYTTTGWIMYLASVAHLLIGGRAIFYDGSPLLPDAAVLLRIMEQQGVTFFGTSPRWMSEVRKSGIRPREDFNLSKLKMVSSTGMVLPDELFEWFYDTAFPMNVHLCNISGGTDIAGCFVIDNPLTPVYVGGTQGPALGVPFAVYDHDLEPGQKGVPLPAGTPGDLVAPAAFPNVPLFLWNDGPKAPGPKYTSAYFSRFKNTWAQGDFCVIHPVTGNVNMLGRSDGVLNPSGVRFGSSDIYGVVEKYFADEIRESICVGQRRPQDQDERVVLFLLMREGRTLTRGLVSDIRERIAKELNKRHVPKYIFEVPDIPTTVNLKKVELPVKHIISGRTVNPSGTLLNPQSLDFFYRFQNVEALTEPQAKL